MLLGLITLRGRYKVYIPAVWVTGLGRVVALEVDRVIAGQSYIVLGTVNGDTRFGSNGLLLQSTAYDIVRRARIAVENAIEALVEPWRQQLVSRRRNDGRDCPCELANCHDEGAEHDPLGADEVAFFDAESIEKAPEVGGNFARAPAVTGRLGRGTEARQVGTDHAIFAGERAPVATWYVQPSHYLCLGDNSPESSDGRSWGLVPRRLLLGRALLVYYPFSRVERIR